MAKYPQYEIKIIYDCELCKDKHVAVGRAVGSALAAELAGATMAKGQTIRGQCMGMAKKGVIKGFFAAHPESAVGDFRVDSLRGIETVVHDEETTDTDKIGIAMTKGEVAEIVEGLNLSEKVDEIEEAEKTGPIETGIKKGMNFEEVRKVVERRLEELEIQEKALIAKLENVQMERKRFEKLVETAKEAEKIEAIKEKIKKEE